VTWSITAAGEIKDIAGKALEDLERELFDAIGPVLTRYGAYASNFAGHHITGAPHQTTSDAAATVTTTTGTVTGEDQGDVTSPDDAGGASVPVNAGTPFATGGIIDTPDTGSDSVPASLTPGEAVIPPATAAEPDPASDDQAPDTGAAATT
jgi:hypothetical protein